MKNRNMRFEIATVLIAGAAILNVSNALADLSTGRSVTTIAATSTGGGVGFTEEGNSHGGGGEGAKLSIKLASNCGPVLSTG